MAACAAARHNALSGPVDSARSRAAQTGRVAGRCWGLTEQNPASGVHDWLVLRMPDCFADRRSWKGPKCQNSCLLSRYFLPACLWLQLRADNKGRPRSSRRVRATPPASVDNNWATMRRSSSACDSTGKDSVPPVKRYFGATASSRKYG